MQGVFNLTQATENHPLTRQAIFHHRQIVQTQHNILGRHDNRLTTGRAKNVVGGHHQHAGFQLRFQRQGNVYGHLVTVKVGVKGGTDQRVQLDRLTLNQHRLKRLDTQTVQGWRTVQQNWMLANNLFQDVPNFWPLTLNHSFGCLNGVGQSVQLQLGKNERLKQLQRHFLGQAALMQLQLWPNHDHRTTGVVHALTQQVLAEATLLTFQHVRQGFEGALVNARNHPTATTVVKQRIHRFLQHPFFVTDDDLRRAQLNQAL